MPGSSNALFSFLQPLADKPSTSGKFNRTLHPVVEICREWDAVELRCRTVLAEFTRTRGPAQTPDETVRVSGNAYSVNWNTARFEDLTGRTFRITVRVGRHTLGFASVDVVGSGGGSRARSNHELVAGRTLPVRFHIAEGALRQAMLESGECVDCVETVVATDEATTVTTPSRDAGAFFPEGSIPAEVGEVTVTINRIRPTPDAPCLPADPTQEQAEGCYRFETEPFLENGFTQLVTVGVCLDPSKEREQFQLYKYSPLRPERGIELLRPTSVNFLSCTDFTVARADGGGSRLGLAAARVGRALARALGPAALHAGDLGEGGMVGSFSRIGWMRSASLVVVQGDGERAASGAAVLRVPVVRVMSGHGADTVPVPGTTVVFRITRGGGSVNVLSQVDSVRRLTDPRGYAAAPWVLGAVGTNTLTATVPGASSVTFTATALTPAPVVNVRVGAPSTLDATVPTVGTIAEAQSLVAVNGRVVVHEGTHRTHYVSLHRPFTIEAAPGVRPVIDANGESWSFYALNRGGGTLVLRGLEFRNATWTNIGIGDRLDRIVVEDNVFHPPVSRSPTNGLGYSSGVFVSGTAEHELLVRNNTFTGGDIGVHANNASPVTVRTNTFTGQGNAAVHVGNQSSGRIEGNTISGCGTRWCIGLFTAGAVHIVDNVLSLDMEHPSFTPIHVHAQSAVVQGNRVIGTGGTLNPQDQSTFPIRWAALHFYQTGSATVVGNTVQRAVNGIWASESSVTGQGNVIADVGTAIGAHNLPTAGAVRIQRNDISRYTMAVSHAQGGHLPDLTCNWWGDSGPRGVEWWTARGVYAPWSPMPVAGIPDAACGTSGFPAVDLVVPGTGRAAGQPVTDNLSDALVWAADGGTVRVQAGTHPASRVLVRRPVVIEGAGLPRPTLDAGGEDASLFVQEVSGPVTIRGLRFQNAKFNNVFVHREYDRVLIESSEFLPGRDPAPQHGLGFWSGVNVGQATGNGVTVQNSSFQGGDVGVNMWQSPTHLVVRNNTFSGQATAGVNTGQGPVTAEGNTFQGCGRQSCINVWEAASGSLLNNTVHVLVAEATDNLINVGSSSQLLVQGNTINGCGRHNCISGWQLTAASFVDNVVNVTMAHPGNHGIGIGQSNDVVIRGNRILGSGGAHNPADSSTFAIRNTGIGVWESSGVTLSGNTLENARFGISPWKGERWVIENNDVRGCGLGCINVGSPGSQVRVSGNRVAPSAAAAGPHHWKSAINVAHPTVAGGVLIENNEVTGAPPADPMIYERYALKAGIHASNWNQGAPVPLGVEVIVSGNTVRNAAEGISAHWGGNIAGTNNRVDGAFQGLAAYARGRVAIQRSDVVNALVSLNMDDQSTMLATCNWWGRTGGPQNVQSWISPSVYTPWATQPIAGNPAVSCGDV